MQAARKMIRLSQRPIIALEVIGEDQHGTAMMRA